MQKGEAVAANDDGRLPLQDKKTRVVVFGTTAQQAKVVAAEITRRAYGTAATLAARSTTFSRRPDQPSSDCRREKRRARRRCRLHATVRSAEMDNGSFDPDGSDTLSLAVLPGGPFGLGQHQVALAGTDRRGASASAAAFVTVSDETALDRRHRRAGVVRRRHGMQLFTIDYIATDNCSGVTTELSVAGRDADDRKWRRSSMRITCC